MKNINQTVKINILFALIVALLLIAVFLLNAVTLALSNRYALHADLTANAAYKVGEETKSLLSSLNSEVEIYVLSPEESFSGSAYLEQAKRIIEQYPRISGNVRLEYIDYIQDPAFAANYPDLLLSPGDVLVKNGDRIKQISAANLFNYTYTADKKLEITSSRAEEAIDSAIINVTSGRTVKIAVLTGNGAADASLFKALLRDNNYEVFDVSLTTESLEEYDAALLLSPVADLSEDAVRKIESYLYNGGQYGKALVYSASPSQGKLPVFDAFLSEWGISFTEGAVFETSADKTYQYQPFYPIAGYGENKYTDMLKDADTPFLLPLSRPMQILFTAKDGQYVETLLSFGETSGARPADAPESFTAADSAVRGPIPAMALASFNPDANSGGLTRSYILVSSSTMIFDALSLQNTSLANAEYMLNVLGDLTEKTDSVNIQPKTLAGGTLGVTSAQVTMLGVLLVGIIPMAIFCSGLTAWLLRRHK